MNNDIQVFRTSEITDDLWEQIVRGFNDCFHTCHDADHLKEYYTSNVMGYSFHAVKINEDGELMGYNSFVPSIYLINGRDTKVVNSGGSFVLEKFRKDIFIYYDLVTALFAYSRKEGYELEVGVPNKNSFKYATKIIKSKYLTDLNYYILPVKISKILNKPSFKIIDLFSVTYSWLNIMWNMVCCHIINFQEKSKSIRIKTNPTFLHTRLGNTARYNKTCNGYYRICKEDGVNTAYIMYFGKESRDYKSLTKIAYHILKTENVDAIMYIGTMNMNQMVLTKVPKRFIPQDLHLCYHVLNKDDKQMADICKDINNWDFGLINFDAR